MSGKLVRDRIPALYGVGPIRVLGEAEFYSVLRARLSEEVAEVLAAETQAECVAELADVLEVLHALVAQRGLSPAELEAVRAAKYSERGGFSARLWWDR